MDLSSEKLEGDFGEDGLERLNNLGLLLFFFGVEERLQWSFGLSSMEEVVVAATVTIDEGDETTFTEFQGFLVNKDMEGSPSVLLTPWEREVDYGDGGDGERLSYEDRLAGMDSVVGTQFCCKGLISLRFSCPSLI
ncbi:hypothetical protein TorRG33x02_292000 [Trema orientale]|uniref:Uncharacterized protein n=1 Tax=Trema orientale TaxID=63057 RepID=A0A2P5CAP2_TREOI|nr:hypothetical protein TorRG33x02_292000 [Trema orientale]